MDSDPFILVLEDTESERNEENLEAVLEEDAEDFSPQHCHYIEEGASCNMHANVEKLTTDVCRSLGLIQIYSPPYHPTPLGTKNPTKTDRMGGLPQKSLLNSIQWIKSLQKAIPVVDHSILNTHLTAPIEIVQFFKGLADRKF